MSLPTNQEQDIALHLHAELLPNIRYVTLYVSLPASLQTRGVRPEISLSESRRAITVSLPSPLDHVADTIKLPARVSEASRHMLTGGRHGIREPKNEGKCDGDQREYSFRMQIDNEDELFLSKEEPLDGFVPWTASDMLSTTRLGCRQCGSIVLDSPSLYHTDSINECPAGWVWKDLPSGNWAEMMDFWHCHKPDTEKEDTQDAAIRVPEDKNATVKGYGAANQVIANPGIVLVDVATFLVSEVDCSGLKQIQSEDIQKPSLDLQTEIHCENCNTLVGVEDIVSRGWRLFKTSLAASTKALKEDKGGTDWHTQSTETVVAAQLLELIERESTRRFVIHSGQKEGLLIWVFNPDLWYTNSSTTHSITAQRAMKILFQTVANVDEMLNPESGKASSLSLEELRLPANVFSAVLTALEGSNEMLPLSARRFREWRVGVMHRFVRSNA